MQSNKIKISITYIIINIILTLVFVCYLGYIIAANIISTEQKYNIELIILVIFSILVFITNVGVGSEICYIIKHNKLNDIKEQICDLYEFNMSDFTNAASGKMLNKRAVMSVLDGLTNNTISANSIIKRLHIKDLQICFNGIKTQEGVLIVTIDNVSITDIKYNMLSSEDIDYLTMIRRNKTMVTR